MANNHQTPSFAIYDASAGSGKTYQLVKEYLKIILTAKKDDAYRNILAITFTNKAVHEMKSRIVGNLSEFGKDKPAKKAADLMQVLSKETTLSVPEIKQKAKNIIRHIIHNYAAFDISTIDKFTHKVIRAFAHDLGLPMTFEVTLDTENLLIEAVDAIIAQAGEDETLTKLLVDFTMEKTDGDKSWDISREILETGRMVLNENDRSQIAHLQEKTIPEFGEIKHKLIEASKALEAENVEFAQRALALIDKNGIDLKSFPYGTFPNHLDFIAKNDIRANKYRFRNAEEIKIKKGVKDEASIQMIIPELLSLLDKVYINAEKSEFYRAFLKNITPLSLLNTVSNELTKIQKEQNLLSIAEFNAIIHKEIQSQPAPFIYERLGERYRHFFIDEFQDTSEMQWQNLIPLIDNALSGQDEYGTKGTLMIVGDPKQSIYRWRGGKAEQFIALGKANFSPFSNPDKALEYLDTNRRSYSEIIEFNNDFFKLISSEFEHLDYKDLYEKHSFQKTNDKIGGYVNISFIPKEALIEDDESLNKTELYVRATLNTILQVKAKGFQYKDIVILTRKRGQGIAIANYLSEQQIPLLSSETLMIGNATEVRLIIYLLRYLKNKADLESKAHFLHYLAKNRQSEMPIHDFIAKGMALYDETAFEQWLLNVDIGLSFKNIRKKALYESVEIIISKFLKKDKSNAYVQYFLDIVLERDMRYQSGIADFLEYWDKKSESFSIPSPEGKDAVRIMTIHKSKGLEFPVVIMPFAEENYSKAPKSKLWLDADESEFGLPKVLIDNSNAVSSFGQAAAVTYSQKKQEELLDNINVLYVALTRAEEQLYVISGMNLTAKGEVSANDMSAFFINYLMVKGLFNEQQSEYSFGNPEKLSEHEAALAAGKIIPMQESTLNPSNIRIAQREALLWGTHQQEAIEYGNIIHEILSYIKDKTDIALAIVKAVENGLITMAQQETVQKTISEIISHPELENFFDAENIVFTEQSIIQREFGTIKPDRMVLHNGNEMLLLDYKTGLHQEKYRIQLENYQKAIESMGYKIAKKALVYIGATVNVVNL